MSIRFRKHNQEDAESIERNNEIWGEDVSRLDCHAEIIEASDPENIMTKYLADSLYDSHMSGNRKGGSAAQRLHRKQSKSVRNN
jgi:hypothetical protein